MIAVLLALSFPDRAGAQEAGSRRTGDSDPRPPLVVHFEEGRKLFSVNEAARIDEFVDRNLGAAPDRAFYISGISRGPFPKEMQLARKRVCGISSYLMRRFRISRGHLVSRPELLISEGNAPDSLANCVILEYQ